MIFIYFEELLLRSFIENVVYSRVKISQEGKFKLKSEQFIIENNFALGK